MEGQIYKVIKDHIPAFNEPIILKKGDKVIIEKYLEVFKDIFEKTDNLEHYNMMMKVEKE